MERGQSRGAGEVVGKPDEHTEKEFILTQEIEIPASAAIPEMKEATDLLDQLSQIKSYEANVLLESLPKIAESLNQRNKGALLALQNWLAEARRLLG